MKASSVWRTCRSRSRAALVSSASPPVASAPPSAFGSGSRVCVAHAYLRTASYPIARLKYHSSQLSGGLGRDWVAVDEEEEDAAEEVVVMAVAEELGHAVKRDEPSDRLDNDPEVSKRLRTFHTV